MRIKISHLLFVLVTGYWLLVSLGYAKEINILYTGETHAMLYPCSCPKESDGGVARRAALIKELRMKNPDTLVLDSGGFFAGGQMDEYTQNAPLDRERTKVALKAIELMQYDALALGDDEFNFGREFLKEILDTYKINFLSSNLKFEKALPYIIKEVAGTKFGIIGLTNVLNIQNKEGLNFIEPRLAVKQAVEELKKNGAGLIVLLSHQGEDEDLKLIGEVAGIDILIVGHNRSSKESHSKIGSTLILRPSWQGRRLGKVSLKLTDNKITDYKVEDLRLSDKIRDNPDILAILPRCFSDANCKKQGFIGACHDPGKLNAQCLYSQPAKVNLFIIMPKACTICDTKTVVNYLKEQFPGLVISYLYYPDAKAEKLIKDFGIKGLPAYLLGREIEKEKAFVNLKENLERKGDFYLINPRFSGMSYLLNRKRIKGKLDLFIGLYEKDTPALLEVVKDFNPDIHFLAVAQKDKFDAAKGNLEVEEYLRSVCVQKYYPEIFWDYLGCRARSSGSSWWEDCLDKVDTAKIKACARSQEASSLLEENIKLNKELQIMFGPTYLLENQEIFSTQGLPSKEELKKIIKR